MKVVCQYCGRAVRQGTRPLRDRDGQQYHKSCFREMTSSIVRERGGFKVYQ